VPDLGGLRHRQELEAVERVRVVVEVGLHHLGRFRLDLARLVEDRGLLALEAAGELDAPLLGLRRLLRHPLQRLNEVRALLLGQLLHLAGRRLRGHREAGHLGQLLLQVRELCHRLPFVSNGVWKLRCHAARGGKR
jgi:hypothetical protein